MRINSNLSKGMRMCISLLIIMCFPVNTDAQFWKKWFRRKKKPKVEVVEKVDSIETVDSIALLARPISSDTVVNLVAYMPDDVKTDSLADFSDYLTCRVNDKVVNANGVQFNMIGVQGGTFLMGTTIDQYYRSEIDEYPCHNVALNTFYIGETEVTQELWQAVMGVNPSNFRDPQAPVEMVSWNDCQLFLSKLNAITGMEFRLPTEAEWEYAARGGCLSGHWMFAGDDFLDGLGWYVSNAAKTMPVKQKRPNELGLYDMSGNVAEWCYDWYGEYQDTCLTNPIGPLDGVNKCVRGGHWIDGTNAARVAFRYSLRPNSSNYHTGLRLVASVTQGDIDEAVNNPQPQRRHFTDFSTQFLETETINVKGVDVNMIGVQGGVFLMGATLEQTEYGDVDEQPCHNVAISSFRIAQTEVTQALWKVVMGTNPSSHRGDNLPVENVSWNDCQLFIEKLNAITGRKFRLPSEAEWEYAARGGNLSKQYSFPGSNSCNEVAWNAHICKSTNPVAIMKPNELCIYDMGGNVAEWCDDWYAAYNIVDLTNPGGPGYGANKVIRGSHWEDGQRYCHCSYRYSAKPEAKYYHTGFRLAL